MYLVPWRNIRKYPNPAGERNKDPILNVLKRVFNRNEPNLFLLEIASGVGLHSSYFAHVFPNITFQPSEVDMSLFGSIVAYQQEAQLENLLHPTVIDISKPCSEWSNGANINLANSAERFDYMLNINMLHISPFSCAEGLFQNASQLLKPGGLLVTYGPYAVNGILTPESNVSFNESLQRRNPEWGIRDTSVLQKLATLNRMTLEEMIDLPANNKCLIWKKLAKP
ncbi:AGAP009967-PA-like protein [Anopheles sinensis]|uniref:AGAP009967-PA-like protein n=1 Tax=Anopheles sinensis TaxID=74873 RepID=A0A084VCN0_ANOSI|nr:AGAP009967-PA-like protein [Anopheles sinensis]